MEEKQIAFRDYLEEEICKVKGTYYPVKVSLPKRLFTKKTRITRLHPNPDDEFCFPDIGPSYEIISRYEQEFRKAKEHGMSMGEPLMVQKSKPDGYLIMNGHHRWAAAYKSGFLMMKIQIVNLTQPKDIREMLQRSRSNRRVTLDLDEVVFAGDGETALEKPMPFPLNRFFRERVRRGIPALFNFLNSKGYDIWVYTSSLYSMDYIQHYFRRWNVRLTGIVTGAGRKGAPAHDSGGELRKMVETRYDFTVHIDNSLVICTRSGSKECEEYLLSGSPASWSSEVMDIITKMGRKSGAAV